ncbi:MAG: hypothetical protein Q8R28_22470 [Dehalococcoidia bacterium]|nr:hypothetical protein [Dehalococcoidia bacterium]
MFVGGVSGLNAQGGLELLDADIAKLYQDLPDGSVFAPGHDRRRFPKSLIELRESAGAGLNEKIT